MKMLPGIARGCSLESYFHFRENGIPCLKEEGASDLGPIPRKMDRQKKGVNLQGCLVEGEIVKY